VLLVSNALMPPSEQLSERSTPDSSADERQRLALSDITTGVERAERTEEVELSQHSAEEVAMLKEKACDIDLELTNLTLCTGRTLRAATMHACLQ
jgi:hypothetical protein